MCFKLNVYTLFFVVGNENMSFQKEVHDTSGDNTTNANSSDTPDDLANGNASKTYATYIIV